MSKENLEVVRRANDAFRAGDWEVALGPYAEDAELDTTRMPGGGIGRGPEGAREFYSRWMAAWDQFQADPLELIDAGDTVVLVSRISGTGKGSGAEVTMRAADVFLLDEGRIVRHVAYPDAADAFADLGLVDSGGR